MIGQMQRGENDQAHRKYLIIILWFREIDCAHFEDTLIPIEQHSARIDGFESNLWTDNGLNQLECKNIERVASLISLMSYAK